jgi:hypothetical protein
MVQLRLSYVNINDIKVEYCERNKENFYQDIVRGLLECGLSQTTKLALYLCRCRQSDGTWKLLLLAYRRLQT